MRPAFLTTLVLLAFPSFAAPNQCSLDELGRSFLPDPAAAGEPFDPTKREKYFLTSNLNWGGSLTGSPAQDRELKYIFNSYPELKYIYANQLLALKARKDEASAEEAAKIRQEAIVLEQDIKAFRKVRAELSRYSARTVWREGKNYVIVYLDVRGEKVRAVPFHASSNHGFTVLEIDKDCRVAQTEYFFDKHAVRVGDALCRKVASVEAYTEAPSKRAAGAALRKELESAGIRWRKDILHISPQDLRRQCDWIAEFGHAPPRAGEVER
jgi:hypothetical protein